jgi:hypothetical protein
MPDRKFLRNLEKGSFMRKIQENRSKAFHTPLNGSGSKDGRDRVFARVCGAT